VFDAGEDGGRPFIVMELVDGETVADLLARRGRVEPAEAARIGVQAASGLAHAHAAGLVHRDVKPQNLLLRRDGTVEIADFGIARAAEGTRLTLAGTVLGTAGYVSPEQALGEDVGPAADVYSLGAVLYELLAGEPPFRFESLAQVAIERPPVRPLRKLAPATPSALEDVVMRCLARNPEYRPTAAALASTLDEGPTERALPPTRIAPAPRRHLGRRWIVAAIVLLLLVAAAALGVALATSGGVKEPPARPAAPRIAPIERGGTPATEARNLSGWIGRYSSGG
jgi:eukaryotic-like serine/threonine-protein kinase